MPLTHRFATAEDTPAIVALYAHLAKGNPPYDDTLAKDNLAKLGAYTGSGILISTLQDTLVSSCTLIIIPNLSRQGTPYALIENVVTHPDHRGQGYGTATLHQACDLAWDSGCYKVMLSTGSQNPKLHDFYKAAGFEQSRIGFQIRRS